MDKYISELKPEWRLVSEERPPISTKCLFLTRWGIACVGRWNPESELVAWCPLPKLTTYQKIQLEDEEKVRYAENIRKLQNAQNQGTPIR